MPGVAVVADSTWAAFKGRDALVVEWAEGAFAGESSATLSAQFQELLTKPTFTLHDSGQRRAGAGNGGARPSRRPTSSRSSRMRRSSRTTARRISATAKCFITGPLQMPARAEASWRRRWAFRASACTCSPRALAVASAGGCCRTTPLKPPSFRARSARRCRSSTTALAICSTITIVLPRRSAFAPGSTPTASIVAWDHVIVSVSRNAYRKDPRPPFSTETYGSYIGRVKDSERNGSGSAADAHSRTRGCATARRATGVPDRRVARSVARGERVCDRNDDRRARRQARRSAVDMRLEFLGESARRAAESRSTRRSYDPSRMRRVLIGGRRARRISAARRPKAVRAGLRRTSPLARTARRSSSSRWTTRKRVVDSQSDRCRRRRPAGQPLGARGAGRGRDHRRARRGVLWRRADRTRARDRHATSTTIA